MVASSAEELPENVIALPELGLRVLRSAAIYGANASGKTNLLLGMQTLADLLRLPFGVTPLVSLPWTVFLLDPAKESEATSFRARFVVDEVLYDYSLSAKTALIQDERLVVYPSGRPQEWFHRVSRRFEFRGSYLKGQKQKLQELTPDNLPYLAVANAFGHAQLAAPARWLIGNLSGRFSHWYKTTVDKCQTDETFFSWANKFLRRVDLGIDTFEIGQIESLEKKTNGQVSVENVPSPFFLHKGSDFSAKFGIDILRRVPVRIADEACGHYFCRSRRFRSKKRRQGGQRPERTARCQGEKGS